MKTLNRQTLIGLALVSLFGATAAGAAEQSAESSSSCQREIRRVAVWPHSSPKAPQFARFENREVTVCDGKIVGEKKRDESRQAQG